MAVSEHEAIWNKPQQLTTNPGGAPKLMLEAFRIEQYNLISFLGGVLDCFVAMLLADALVGRADRGCPRKVSQQG